MKADYSPELEELVRDGFDKIERFGDDKLRRYAIWTLRSDGATSTSSMTELANLAAANAVRCRQQHALSPSGDEGTDLGQLFVDLADALERELGCRALPN